MHLGWELAGWTAAATYIIRGFVCEPVSVSPYLGCLAASGNVPQTSLTAYTAVNKGRCHTCDGYICDDECLNKRT